MPKLDSFKSYDDAAGYLYKQSDFQQLPPDQQDQALAKLKQKWDMRPGKPGEQPDITARINAKIGDAVKGPFGGVITGAALGPAGALIHSVSPELASRIVKGALPSNNIPAGIDAAMLATGGLGEGLELGSATARLGARLAVPTLGGAAGGATEGKAKEGAAKGLFQGAVGEVAAPVFNKIFGSTIGRLDREKLGGWVKKNLPTKLPWRTVGDFDQNLRGGLLREEMGPMVEQANQKVAAALGANDTFQLKTDAANKSVISPLVEMPGGEMRQGGVTTKTWKFHEILQEIRRMEDLGRYTGNDNDLRLAAKTARVSAHQMVDDLQTALNERQPGLGDSWLKPRKQYQATMTLQQMFSEPGVLDPKTGQINMGKLQQLASSSGREGYRDELKRAGIDESFLKTAFRGANNFVRTDAQGKVNPYYRMHLGVIPSMGAHPELAHHVGYLPYDLGRGRALSAALVLGPHRLLNLIANEMGRKLPYPEHEPKPVTPEMPPVLPPTKVVQSGDVSRETSGIRMDIRKSPEEMAAMK